MTVRCMKDVYKEDVYKDSSKDKEILETAGAPVKEFVRFKPKIYSFLLDDRSQHKKEKGLKKIVVATIIHNEYKDFLMFETLDE